MCAVLLEVVNISCAKKLCVYSSIFCECVVGLNVWISLPVTVDFLAHSFRRSIQTVDFSKLQSVCLCKICLVRLDRLP